MNTSTPTLAFDPALAAARQSLYRFAATTLLDPKNGAWEQLAPLRHEELLVEAAAFIRELPEAVPAELALGERPLIELNPCDIFAKLPDTPAGLLKEYENTYGLLVSSACPPYEMEYVDGKFTFQRSHLLADVAGYYRAFGLDVSSQRPERPDHIANQLEFMAVLIGLQRQAANEPDTATRDERIDVCQQAQVTFLRDHLAWWAPAFSRLLARENPDSFYAAVGGFLAALIAAERALLDVAATGKVVTPSTIEPPETCDGCEIA
jgi:TorA maturation chaperone TorD